MRPILPQLLKRKARLLNGSEIVTTRDLAANLASEREVDRAKEDAADHVTEMVVGTTEIGDEVTHVIETADVTDTAVLGQETGAEADHVTAIPDVDLEVDHVTAKDHVKTTVTTETANEHAMKNLARE